jgi:hypothetical protein
VRQVHDRRRRRRTGRQQGQHRLIYSWKGVSSL